MMTKEIPLLKAEDIEVKVKQITEKGALALLYKTARTDMEILDRVFGIGNWQCHYEEIKGNLYCTISIWDEEKGQWVAKCDCGIESREDDEGNQKKGEASDAFKRAGFRVGIGRELYTSPFIWLKVDTAQDKNGKWQLTDRFAKFVVGEIGYDSNKKINLLRIVNAKSGEEVYTFGVRQNRGKATKKEDAPKGGNGNVAKVNAVPPVVPDNYNPEVEFNNFCNEYGITSQQFIDWRIKASQDANTGVVFKEFKAMTNTEWVELFTRLGILAEQGYFK